MTSEKLKQVPEDLFSEVETNDNDEAFDKITRSRRRHRTYIRRGFGDHWFGGPRGDGAIDAYERDMAMMERDFGGDY